MSACDWRTELPLTEFLGPITNSPSCQVSLLIKVSARLDLGLTGGTFEIILVAEVRVLTEVDPISGLLLV